MKPLRAPFLGSRWMRIALAVAGATLAWAYVPPMGPRLDLPHMEPFFEPGVPHGKPVFIRSGQHVHYRTLLHRPVAPWFSWDYFERMRLRGVQFEERRSSRSALLFRREGWDIAMAREKALSPYTIEYWKSADGASFLFPVFMRWPWVYVRLSTTVLQTHSAVLVPQEDATSLAVEIPRYPGSVLKSVASGGQSESITLYYLVEAAREDIQRFYSRRLLGMEMVGRTAGSGCEDVGGTAIVVSRPGELLLRGRPPPKPGQGAGEAGCRAAASTRSSKARRTWRSRVRALPTARRSTVRPPSRVWER